MTRQKKESPEPIGNNQPTDGMDRRHYIQGLSQGDLDSLRIEGFLDRDPTFSATLKRLIKAGLTATRTERFRRVRALALLWGCTFEQAWVRIAADRPLYLDLRELSDQEFIELYGKLEKPSVSVPPVSTKEQEDIFGMD